MIGFAAAVIVLANLVPPAAAESSTTRLVYAPAPPDNPLKGFVPYLRADTTFPHSLEWDYTKLSDVMSGPTNFHWAPFEAKLAAAALRGHQFFARFYLEWPGKTTGVPRYLLDAGVKLRTWTNTNTQPFPPAVDHTPDYEDLRLRAALTNFIHALGRRYDGDPRLGFVGLGLLGTWGEWHNSPNDDWFASKTVQREVMDAYETAFRKTKLVARYPAGPNDPRYADNSTRAIGYHDDSFAWATVHTGRRGDAWFFESRLRSAGALDKWRTQPIGGEVRPEVWSTLFDEPTGAPEGQEFDRCLAVTHASWLCNEGVFRGKIQGPARQRAVRAAQQMGYELHVAGAQLAVTGGQLAVALTVTNTGVAPFYYDWPVELGTLDASGKLAASWKTDWKLTGILPGEPAMIWRGLVNLNETAAGVVHLVLRVPNPLTNGPPLRFANQTQDQHFPGCLTLGSFENQAPAPPQDAVGWTVQINTRLWETNPTQTRRALELLSAQLEEIVRVVPDAALTELRRVPLWLSPEYPGTPPTAEYHPDAGWLREHGRDPAMAKAVEFTNVRSFEEETRRMPNFVLHELAHAYHDRVLGFEEPRILAAYEKARASGTYDRVQRRDAQGRVKLDRAYALRDPKEYFAETTEAFFSANDFYPFTREELKRHDPEMFHLLERLWSEGHPSN